MTNKNNDINFWIVRFLMILLFFLLLSFSNNESKSKIDSCSVSFEQVDDYKNPAIFIKPVSFPNHNICLEICEHCAIKSQNIIFNLWIYNNRISQQIKIEELRFYQFRPNLLKTLLIHLQLASHEDYQLIS